MHNQALVAPESTRRVTLPSRTRYESLDHWRGLACLLVVIYHSTMMYITLPIHAAPTSAATAAVDWVLDLTNTFNVGVTLFFVISGYCISAAADSVRAKGYGVGQYFVRRFRRIYPPLWIAIVCSIAFFLLVDYLPVPGLLSHEPWAQPRPFWYSPSQWFGNLTLTETWRHYVFGAPRGHFPGQAWTLCYEEQFYLLTGALLMLPSTWYFSGVLCLTAGTVSAIALSRELAFPIDGFFFDGSWLLFAAGVAAYYSVNQAMGWRSLLVQWLLVAAVPMAFITDTPSGGTAGFALAAALPLLHPFDQNLASIKALSPLRVAGQMCYSLYLVHQLPVRAISAGFLLLGWSGPWTTLFVTVPVSFTVALILGWVFHVNVERRFMNSAPMLTSRVPRMDPGDAVASV